MKKFNQILVFSIMIVGTVLLNACGVAMPAVEQNVDVSPAVEAHSARYTALAEYYTTQTNQQQATEAEAARYTGLADYFVAGEVNPQRAIEAESARYTGLAAYFTSQ